MKINIKKGVAAVAFASLAASHPNLSKLQQSEPCPFLEQSKLEEQQRRLGEGWKLSPMRSLSDRSGDGGVPDGGFKAVMDDLKILLTDSQEFWPGDFAGTAFGPHYGGLFIRLAWHCNGSYRDSDGRGGCDGGRIRFDPEINWPDNANLDKAIQLLQPIKEKYGPKLSWGDLITLSGTAAIEGMGGKILGFCGGRIDDANGDDSLKLGPSDEQEEIAPCISLDKQGDCLSVEGTAAGPTTMGLIYVDPAGPKGAIGDPVASGADIRRAFARMGFDDRTSVALIGGGHAFGKCHGACFNASLCGDAGGDMTFTSGFEGQWTTTPTVWGNEYFQNLFQYNWTKSESPANLVQFVPVNADSTPGPDIIMLTTDLAMAMDEIYEPISREYADDLTKLEDDFAAAWYRLTSSDMGPHTRCIGDMVPDPQPFQYTLPAGPTELPDYVPVRKEIQSLLDGDELNSNAFINLAYRCASTYRATDYRGGCNGARIRFSPEKDWEVNTGTSDAIDLLAPIKEKYPEVSYADLIVLSGITALEDENEDLEIPFCGGYVDAENADGSEVLAPRIYSTPYITVTDDFLVKGLTMEEGVALASRENVSSEYYKDLIDGNGEFSDDEKAMLDGDLRAFVESFANDEEKLISAFEMGWTKLMTSDRYLNYRENACKDVSIVTTEAQAEADKSRASTSSYFSAAGALCVILSAVAMMI